MKSSIIFPVLLALFVATSVPAIALAPTTASTTFNLNGVTGWIRFYEMENENVTSILVNLVGFDGQIADWSIRQLPVDSTLQPLDRCSEDYLGGVYNATTVQGIAAGDLTARFGQISSNGLGWFNDRVKAITLQGPGSVIGRSLLLQVGSRLICSTIRSKLENNLNNVITMQATLISPVAGTVYFRKYADEPTVIHGKLFWINEMTTTSVEWSIYDDLVTETYRAGVCGNPLQRFLDLTAMHGNVTVSGTPLPYSEGAFLFTDKALMLSGLMNIEGRTLVISQGATIISCAPIVISENLETVQYPDLNFRISQSSPHENSTLTMSDSVTTSTYAILSSALMTNTLCPLSEAPYNPIGVTAPGSTVIVTTPDMFPKGDISGKFSSLMGPSQQLNLPELPVYGPFTLMGRTMREISTDSRQPYRVCSALLPIKDELSTTLFAKATFNQGSVGGAIYFLQRQDPEGSELPGMTTVIVDLYYVDPSMDETTTHKWHVHVDLPQEGVECVFAVGWHFNPFNVDLGSTYGAECGIDAPLRCESGDLSGKHGTLTISPPRPGRSTVAFVDPNLQLDGEYKIVGRSIGLHRSAILDPNAVLFSCAAIELVQVNEPQFDVIVAFPESADFERIAFTQDLLRRSPLVGKIDPSDILILQEEVGTVISNVRGTTCATAQMKITTSTVEKANMYASELQNSVCKRFKDNGCMTQLPNYEMLCAGANGAAQVLASFSEALIIAAAGLLINTLF